MVKTTICVECNQRIGDFSSFRGICEGCLLEKHLQTNPDVNTIPMKVLDAEFSCEGCISFSGGECQSGLGIDIEGEGRVLCHVSKCAFCGGRAYITHKGNPLCARCLYS